MSTRILAFDTTNEACSIALLLDGNIDVHFELCVRKHTQRVIPLINEILTRNKLTLTQLDALAFSRGPGSFTGVRIGLGIAQGLAFGANLPLLSISTLMTMAEVAWQRHKSTNVLVAVDARMGEIYWAEYHRSGDGQWHGEESEMVLKPEEALIRMQQLSGEWITIGTGWQIWSKLIIESPLKLNVSEITLPEAEMMLPLAKQHWLHGKVLLPEQVTPTYLRNNILKTNVGKIS